jgi:hypothetical protein
MKTIDLTTPASALAYLRSLDPATEISLPGAHETQPDPGPGDAVAKITGQSANQWATAMNRWEWTAGELVAALQPTAANYEIVFDNGGGATLQTHDGKIAINYSDMRQLAHDARAIVNGETAEGWDGIDPEHFISDEEYDKNASNGGYYALQLDPQYRHNWPDPDDTGWNNLSAFLRNFTTPTP